MINKFIVIFSIICWKFSTTEFWMVLLQFEFEVTWAWGVFFPKCPIYKPGLVLLLERSTEQDLTLDTFVYRRFRVSFNSCNLASSALRLVKCWSGGISIESPTRTRCPFQREAPNSHTVLQLFRFREKKITVTDVDSLETCFSTWRWAAH